MKIRFLIQNAYVGGGTARTTLSTASALAERGHDVQVVSLVRRRRRPRFGLHPAVELTALTDERRAARELGGHGLLGRLSRRARAAAAARSSRVGHPRDPRVAEWSLHTDAALVRYLLGVRGGVLVGTRPALNLALARFVRPGVVRIAQDHMNLASYHPELREEIARRYGRLDAVVALTERDAGAYAELLGPGIRVLAIPNGVPGTGGHRSTLERRVVVAAGRLVHRKGFDRLLDVWALVTPHRPRWKLRIYGAGDAREAIAARIEELGLGRSVRLMGRTPRIFAAMAKGSVFALTSRREGLPMVLLEAMGVGLPVVSYDIRTGPRDLVDEGVDGFVVPDGDAEAFAARLLELMGDVELRRRMSAAALAKAARFDVAHLAERWEALFAELAAVKRGR